jgi:hypothetical protein
MRNSKVLDRGSNSKNVSDGPIVGGQARGLAASNTSPRSMAPLPQIHSGILFRASSEDAEPGADPQGHHAPPYCYTNNCVLAPHRDTVNTSDALRAGAPTREVEYDVFSLNNGVLSQIDR